MNLLLAVDHSEASAKAVRFVAELLGGGSHANASITLFHVLEDDSASKCETLVEQHRQALIQSGLRENAVRTKLQPLNAEPAGRKVHAALALIDEMRGGTYDVVCLGRRGSSKLEGTFLGSVAEKVLREAQGKTVWVVD